MRCQECLQRIQAGYAADIVNELENVLNSESKSSHNLLITNRLSLNISKTEFIASGSRQKIRAIDDEIIRMVTGLSGALTK